MPPPPPRTALLMTKSLSSFNDHAYCTDSHNSGYMKIMSSFHVTKTCRQYGQPGHNMITCGRLHKTEVRPQNLKPLPEVTSHKSGSRNGHRIQQGSGANCCSAPTADKFQGLTDDQPCKLCKCYAYQTKHCYITRRNSSSILSPPLRKITL